MDDDGRRCKVRIETAADTCRSAARTFGLVGGETPRVVPTGFAAVDDAIGGVVVGTGCILAARTGVGKSSVALGVMMSDRSGTLTGWISLEDGRDVVGPRMISALGRVDSLDVRRGLLDEQGRARALRALDRAKRVPVWFVYLLGGTVADVEEAVGELAAQGCQRIVIDHLHRLRSGESSRTSDVAGAHARLLAAFDRHQVAGVVIAQVRRQQRDKNGKLPRLTIHDIKESGDVENDARLILLIDRLEDDTLEVTVGKSTVGAEGLSWRYRRDPRGNLVEVA